MGPGASYLSVMPRAVSFVLVLMALATIAVALPAHAGVVDDLYSIMTPERGGHKPQPKPEPWLPPKYQSPRGTKQHISVPHPTAPTVTAPTAPKVPPPIVVPETGRVLPNLPTISPSGPNGTESFQDRAARCAHQAGVYGDATGNRTNYINSCINQ